MLVLSRKVGEVVVAGSDVRITVVAVQGSRVKLGITAPQEIAIRRAELDGKDSGSATPAETRDHVTQLGPAVVGP